MVNMKQNQVKQHTRLNKRSVFLWPLFCLGMMVNPNPTYAINWQYVNGSSGYNHTNGSPIGMTNKAAEIPSGVLTLLRTLLPEGQSIYKNPDPKLSTMIKNDMEANIQLKSSAKITISFIDKQGAYNDSIGYFKFSQSSLGALSVSSIIDKIIFPNVSVLQFGNAVDIGSFSAGDAIGFTLAADAWNFAIGAVDPNISVNKIFRSIRKLNPESLVNLKGHSLCIVLDQLIVVGFEDLNNETPAYNIWQGYNLDSDSDFNDVFIGIHISPWSAVDYSNCNYIKPPPAPHFDGESGQISWREVTTPKVVADPVKEAKAAAKVAEKAAKAAAKAAEKAAKDAAKNPS